MKSPTRCSRRGPGIITRQVSILADPGASQDDTGMRSADFVKSAILLPARCERCACPFGTSGEIDNTRTAVKTHYQPLAISQADLDPTRVADGLPKSISCRASPALQTTP